MLAHDARAGAQVTTARLATLLADVARMRAGVVRFEQADPVPACRSHDYDYVLWLGSSYLSDPQAERLRAQLPESGGPA